MYRSDATKRSFEFAPNAGTPRPTSVPICSPIESARAHESDSAQSDQRIHARRSCFNETARECACRIGRKTRLGQQSRRRVGPGAFIGEREAEETETARRSSARDATSFGVFPAVAQRQTSAVAFDELRVTPALADQRAPGEALQIRPEWQRHFRAIVAAKGIAHRRH